MRVDADSMDSIRMATALIEGPGLSDERRRQIAEVIRFAQRMVSVASRVRVHTRHAWPSATASNEESGRWVELLAGDDEFRLEFWESRTTLERPPSPERVQTFHQAATPRWILWAVDNSEAWLYRAEDVRWVPAPSQP